MVTPSLLRHEPASAVLATLWLKQFGTLDKEIGQIIRYSIAGSVLLTVVALLFKRKMMAWINAHPERQLQGAQLTATTIIAGAILGALVMLLGAERLFTLAPNQRLLHILRESRKYQNEVSTALAEQVLGALHDLLRGFQAADDATRGALLGAVLGFLPWNFNPAVIFLGDCGSLLIGYLVVVSILLLGEHGDTHLVFAGLIIFALPIMDTSLAILRRKLAGVPMSTADANHIHHIAKRSLGGVKRAVVALYGMSIAFALIGIVLGALAIEQIVRLRIVYAASIVLFGAIGAVGLKLALRSRWVAQLEQTAPVQQGTAGPAPTAPTAPQPPQP
jgi:hypothetical protein